MRAIVLCTLVGVTCVVSAWAQPGAVSGTVSDQTPSPVAGATVFCKGLAGGAGAPMTTMAATPVPPVSASTVTDSKGAFLFSGLTAGSYYVCAAAPSPGLLTSCAYGPKPLIVQVGAGQQASAAITLISGTIVRAQVRDPGGKISQGHRVSVVSMAADGTYEIGKSVSQAALETDYQMTVPKNGNSLLMVQTDLSVTDANGVTVPVSRPVVPVPATAASGSPVVIALTVN